MTSDLYGASVRFSGRVAGLGAGTGSAFSLLPAQNASGNWIKIVQRIPVRVALDPEQLAKYPLRIGLSMNVAVDTRNDDGPMLADAPPDSPPLSTDVFESLDRGADEAVRKVIAAHLQGSGANWEAKAAARQSSVQR